ncbi:MAG: hypothetical protein H6895_13345 [Defluviimonas sp.]|uniref:hypothetical protein n=1 Tax=Albidovulum sp. TaxID=1872424 RepID=UPI002A2C3D5E|nr:hypothetical protein [Defluviimonas sp.]
MTTILAEDTRAELPGVSRIFARILYHHLVEPGIAPAFGLVAVPLGATKATFVRLTVHGTQAD